MPAEMVRLELYRDSAKISDVALIANEGNYRWKVPVKSKPGSNYQLKVASQSRPQHYKLSTNFKIRHRTPFLLKALPAAVAAAVGYILLSRDEPIAQELDLPEPDVTYYTK